MAKKKRPVVEPRSAGRKIIGGLREKIRDMSTVQLFAFFNGFTPEEVESQLKAIEKVKESRSKVEIKETEKEIKRLQGKLKDLKDK